MFCLGGGVGVEFEFQVVEVRWHTLGRAATLGIACLITSGVKSFRHLNAFLEDSAWRYKEGRD